MKRLLQFVAVTAVTFFIPMAISVPASAAFVCKVGYTGPDSQNTCTSEVAYECTVKNTNEVTIENTNEQTAVSGTVQVDDSGNGGGAVSGSTSNNNDVTFNVVVENGETCMAHAVVPATETPETPTTPVTPTQTVTPKALPVTSGSAVPVVLASVGGIAAVVGIAATYRRLHL